MKMILSAAAIASVGLIALATTARAAPQTFDVTFTAHGFTSEFGQPVPVDPVTGSFLIAIDPTQTYIDEQADLANFTINTPVAGGLSFTYSPTGVTGQSSPGELVVGGVFDGAFQVQINPPTDDFYLQIPNFFTAPTYQQLGYVQAAIGAENLFDTHSDTLGSVTVTPVLTSGVPEPSTWAMLLTGFGFFGLLGYRKTRSDNALA
jgi:hypothetical protein